MECQRTAQRFAAYEEALGDRFVARVIPDSAAHPEPPPFFEEVVGTPHHIVVMAVFRKVKRMMCYNNFKCTIIQ